jgi:NADPH:quinone reductase-like Zn-dependent oxidoreductase
VRAIVIKHSGGPEVLQIATRPDPEPTLGHVLIEVKAFGVNKAEAYFRSGVWGEVAEITGIECVGTVIADPGGRYRPGEKVMAIVGGLGRTLNGSYAEMVNAPTSNVVPVETNMPWSDLAALPESYATAWTAIFGILNLQPGQSLLVRGATSALGQAAVNIAANAGAYVIATTRREARLEGLRALGASQVKIERPDMSTEIRAIHSEGVDCVLDIVGTTTLLDSVAALKRGGHVCVVGFLGGSGPLEFDPVFQLPGGRLISAFASAMSTGTEEFPLSEIPFQTIVDRAGDGTYQAKPMCVFDFSEIENAHRLLESGEAGGKIVVTL